MHKSTVKADATVKEKKEINCLIFLEADSVSDKDPCSDWIHWNRQTTIDHHPLPSSSSLHSSSALVYTEQTPANFQQIIQSKSRKVRYVAKSSKSEKLDWWRLTSAASHCRSVERQLSAFNHPLIWKNYKCTVGSSVVVGIRWRSFFNWRIGKPQST